jgi:hypothetical protein
VPIRTLFDNLPLWGVFVSIMAVVMLAVEGGYLLGKLRRARPEREKEASVGPMVGATLGLLAFVLAFTFALAASRFDDRRHALLDEANAIATAYLRAGLVPEPDRSEIRKLLSEYVDVRLSALQRGGNVEETVRRSKELHDKLWAQAEALAEKIPQSRAAGQFTQSLNDVFDLHAKRVMLATRNHIPGIIWVALYMMAVLAMGQMGYHAALIGSSRSPVKFTMALAFSIVIVLIADLDRPHEGLLMVDQQEMVEVKNMILEMKH